MHSTPAKASFDYAVLRVVPRVEREEFVNIGVIVFCLEQRFLAAKVHVDVGRLKALWPTLDTELIQSHANAVIRIAEGDPTASPIAALPQRERFAWLISPRSTILQTSPVHTGICTNCDNLLEQLFTQLVATAKTNAEC